MSDSNLTKHPDFVHIGPAVLKFYDEENDWMVDLGKVTELMLRKTVEKIYMTEVYNGVAVQSRGQSVAESWELGGKFVETLDPNTQYLVFKNCGTPSVTNVCSIKTVTELLQVFSGRCRVLTFNKGFLGTGLLPPPAACEETALTTPVGTFGGVNSYTIAIAAVYEGGAQSNVTYSSNIVPVTPILNQSLLVHIDPPAGGVIPASYNIYVKSSAEADYQFWGNTTSTDIVFLDPVTGGDTMPVDGTTSFTVTSEDGLTTYVIDTDYTVDVSCAGLCIIPDGDICDGQWVKVSYAYMADPEAVMSIGPSNRIPKYAHPVIIAFKNDSRSTPAAKGVEIHLWKTDFDFGFEWDLSSLNFESGFAFTVPVLFSETDLNFGEITTLSERFECYGLKDLRALTQFSQNAACETEES